MDRIRRISSVLGARRKSSRDAAAKTSSPAQPVQPHASKARTSYLALLVNLQPFFQHIVPRILVPNLKFVDASCGEKGIQKK